MSNTIWKDDDKIVYVTQHEQQYPADDVEHDEALLRAIIRAIKNNPRLHAELVIALEHKV